MSDENEVRIKNETTGGEKGQKDARFDLIPAVPMRQVATHYGIGAKKYDDRNWERGYDWSLSIGALERHLNDFKAGEDIDEETQSPHLAAVVFHALALMEFGHTHPELDNRVKRAAEVPTTPIEIWVKNVMSALGITDTESEPVEEPKPVLVPGYELQSFDEWDRLPVGTVLRWQFGANRAVKLESGLWKDDYVPKPVRPQGEFQVCWVIDSIPEPVEPEPAPTGRVSVRKIHEALVEVPIYEFDRPRDEGGVLVDHEPNFLDRQDVVSLLDALEDAGYEITYAPKA